VPRKNLCGKLSIFSEEIIKNLHLTEIFLNGSLRKRIQIGEDWIGNLMMKNKIIQILPKIIQAA